MEREPSLTAALAETRPYYDAIMPLEKQLADLQTIPLAQKEYDTVLAEFEEQLKSLGEQLTNLRREERQTEVQPPPRPRGKPTGNVRYEPVEWAPPDGTMSATGALPPRADPARIREEIKQAVTRFARYRLNQKDTNILATFNYLARDPDVPPGKLLAVLDWDVIFAAPLHELETVDEHVKRLEIWRGALLDYGERLRGDIRAQEQQYQKILNIWKAWKKRGTEPQEWNALVNEARDARREEIANMQKEIIITQARIAQRRGDGDAGPTGRTR
jgi:hypothetical protein